MTRTEFNAAVKACKHCSPRSYCGFHTAVNADVTLREGREEIRQILAQIPAGQQPTWAPAFAPFFDGLSTETLLRMSIPFVQGKKREVA